MVYEPKRRYTTAATWEQYRLQICNLYKERTLEDVVRFMDIEHGFTATPRMYKLRLKKWGLNKYNQRSGVRNLVDGTRKPTDRDEGNPQTVCRGSQRVSNPFRNGRLPESGITESRRLRCIMDATTAHDSFSCTISTPTEHRSLERVIYWTQECIRQRYEVKEWLVASGRIYLAWKEAKLLSFDLFAGVAEACALFAKGTIEDNRTAMRHLEAATANIREISRTGTPFLLIELLRLLLTLCQWEGRPEIAKLILRAFAGFRAHYYGFHDPLYLLCHVLMVMEGSALIDALQRSIVASYHAFIDGLCSVHHSFIRTAIQTQAAHSPEHARHALQTDRRLDTPQIDGRKMRAHISSTLHLERINDVAGRNASMRSFVDELNDPKHYRVRQGYGAVPHTSEDIETARLRRYIQGLLWRLEAWEVGGHTALKRTAVSLRKAVEVIPDVSRSVLQTHERLTLPDAVSRLAQPPPT